MSKLNKEETLQLASVVVRSLSKIKGRCLDNTRLALPKEKQDTLSTLLKNYEQETRVGLFHALYGMGLTEQIPAEELARLK